jgi:hypothetical protein
MEPPLVNRGDLAPRAVEVGHLRADWTFVGPAAGCLDVGVRRLQVQPGWFSTPQHVHAHDEETFFVLAGSGLSVQDDKAYEVRARLLAAIDVLTGAGLVVFGSLLAVRTAEQG